MTDDPGDVAMDNGHKEERSRERERSDSGDRDDRRERSRDRRERDRSGDRNRSRDRSDRRNDRDRSREREPVRSLYIRGLADGTRSDDLMAAFEKYGKVRDVYIPKDFYNNRIRGFAYVQYHEQAEADRAYQRIEYLTINGKQLKVEWAAGNRKTPDQMRKKTDDLGSRSPDRSDRFYRPRGGGLVFENDI
ncbi:Serine/arginine-rich splicing factor 12 [Phlyctochytrium planicorne]|nr:Serine/arginine-rich splicing factor 12 [Phlyctochytrium planicorne]